MGTLTDLDRGSVLAHLQSRIDRMQESRASELVPTHPALAGWMPVRAGRSYEVDSATVALALLAGPSRAGGWVAAVGDLDFGAEAADQMGVDLARTVLVPDPGEHWVEATAALIGVASMVLLRPPEAVGRAGVTPGVASRLDARLRKHGTVLVVRGSWPGREARLTLQDSHWTGIGPGIGRLRERRVAVAVRRMGAPAAYAGWLLRDADEARLTGRADPGLDGQRTARPDPDYPAGRGNLSAAPARERAG